MNAKKIMGAVLVALLAAALFIGAGAAADAKSVGTVFVYQDAGLEGTWTGAAGSVTFVDGVIAGEDIKAGVYTNESGYSMYLCYPTAVISAIANNNSVKYPVIGGNFYKGTNWLNISIASPAGAMIDNILITYPDGSQMKAWDVLPGMAEAYPDGVLGTPMDFANGTVTANIDAANLTKLLKDQTGTFKLQAIFNATAGAYSETVDKPLVDWIPDKYLVAQDAYTITVIGDEQEVAISASVDKVLKGKTFTVTVTGMPGNPYQIKEEDDETLNFISAGALSIDKANGKFTMPNGGSITVYMNYTGDEDEITLIVGDAEVTIEILEPTLTATVGASSYFIGDVIKVTLTTDGELDSNYKFNITGTNLDELALTNNDEVKKDQKEKGVWNIDTAKITKNGNKKLDVGTYTIKIYSNAGDLLATVPVVLKQPFISIVEAPEVITQGKKAEFIINAEATEKIQYYIFGTNYFLAGNTTDNVKDTENQFIVKLNESVTSAKNMSTGQYFAVFQHMMYDKMFNIYANGTQIVLNETGKTNVTLFNVNDRQTANAAQALCDALDSQNIDDMYVKASFFVVGKDESFTISEIPTEVAQGETFTISGVSTSAAGDYVTVEMISTAFAAVPKETVGSAAFIAVSTKVADDGTWEITMDTSDLNVDEYSLKVAVTPANGGETETWKNVNINVVEAGDEPVTPPTDEPGDEPSDEPVAPETPGFGALAALAGLGAVAVLLLRRE